MKNTIIESISYVSHIITEVKCTTMTSIRIFSFEIEYSHNYNAIESKRYLVNKNKEY